MNETTYIGRNIKQTATGEFYITVWNGKEMKLPRFSSWNKALKAMTDYKANGAEWQIIYKDITI